MTLSAILTSPKLYYATTALGLMLCFKKPLPGIILAAGSLIVAAALHCYDRRKQDYAYRHVDMSSLENEDDDSSQGKIFDMSQLSTSGPDVQHDQNIISKILSFLPFGNKETKDKEL